VELNFDGNVQGRGLGRISEKLGPDGFSLIVQGFDRVAAFLKVIDDLVKGYAFDGNGVNILVDFLAMESGKDQRAENKN
jgi:hypothetical protein